MRVTKPAPVRLLLAACALVRLSPLGAQPLEQEWKRQFEVLQYDIRNRGLFVGSGVVEAGCKSVIGQRLKRSGMEWSLRGANAIISLRCTMVSNRFDDYWEERSPS